MMNRLQYRALIKSYLKFKGLDIPEELDIYEAGYRAGVDTLPKSTNYRRNDNDKST